MKVAITHTRYSYVGGVEKYIYSLVQRLLDAGHEVHYFCHFWEEGADPRIQFHKVPNPFKAFRYLKVWSFNRWSEEAVKQADYDLVHGFTKTAHQDIYTDGSGCLLDYQEYSIKEGESSALLQAMKRLSPHQRLVEGLEAERFKRGNFRRIVTMSRFAQEQILRRYHLKESEVEVVYNGIDLEQFDFARRPALRAEMRQGHGYGEEDVVALIVANDYRRKGLSTLLEAAKRIKDAGGLPDGRQLHIAVVGKERKAREKELQDKARALGLEKHTRFFGPQRNIADWHALSDIHVLPTRFDIFGNVVLEAMAMAVPTIVSKMAGAAEVVVPGETGFVLQNPKDADELSELLQKTCRDGRAGLERMGQAAQLEAQKYSWDVHFRKMMSIYQDVIAEKQKSPRAGSHP